MTASVKVMVTKLVSPMVKELSATTIDAEGPTVSMTIALLAARELLLPGVARVRTASAWPVAVALIEPPFRSRAEVET